MHHKFLQHAMRQAVAHMKEESDEFGILLGCVLPEAAGIAVLGCARTLSAQVDWEEEARSVSVMLPSGIHVLGIYCNKEREAHLQNALVTLRTHLAKLGASFAPKTLLAATVSWDPEVGISCAALDDDKSVLSSSVDPSVEEGADDMLPTAMLARLTSKLTIAPGDASAALALQQQQDASFCVISHKEEVEKLVTLRSHGTLPCSDLASPFPAQSSSSQGGKGGGSGKGGKGGGKGGAEATTCAVAVGGASVGGFVGEKMLLKLEQVWPHGADNKSGSSVAPVISLLGGGSPAAGSTFTLEVLAMTPEAELPLAELISRINERGALQLAAAAACLAADDACRPTALHFSLKPHHPFPITVVVPLPAQPLDAHETCLLGLRKQLHRRFQLETDRPFFRVPQGLSLKMKSEGLVRLRNVHEGLAPSGISGGKVHVVQGVYEYCHYMQDKFDDNGWGCMYRSYQTVVSWFREQHYTHLPIQTHEEIQRMLVQMGDKPQRFIGSKQWIGAMEAQMLLDQYLGVSSKIMNVPSGHDLEDKGRELAQHFDTQGSPISIGGGVLAFTILGVHYNSETCQIRFLILDPHYTGSEDLSIIQNQSKKNACSGIPSVGWHDINVFRKDSFYNLCLPQRPKAI